MRGPGEWLTAADGDAALFEVMERNDLPSSTAGYDGDTAALRVDFGRDVLSLGPLEEQGHAENPVDGGPGRGRVVTSDGVALPAAFTGLARGDGDEAWQFHRYLVGHRLVPYDHDVVFNSDGTDQNRISTGAKDDMDIATVREVAPIARDLGVDTFVLDDGWQAASGDWQPDSPQYPEPRGKFGPRFPDATFAAVRDAIGPMRLGLWMSPMNFNPASAAYKEHPDWACAPTGHGLAVYTAADPDSSSNEAGLGFWSVAALPHVERRIRVAIEDWDVRFFKFDFLAWLDCAGANDLYGMHDAFLAMIDRLGATTRRSPSRSTRPTTTAVPVRVGLARADLVPERRAGRQPPAAQPLEPQPVRPHVRDRPQAVRRERVAEPADRHGHGRGAALAHAHHHRPAQAPAGHRGRARPWIDWAKAHRADLDGVTYPLLADPLGKGWTALQSWDPEAGRGVLLAFRQQDAAGEATVALRNVPDGDYVLREAPTDEVVGTATAAQLRSGLPWCSRATARGCCASSGRPDLASRRRRARPRAPRGPRRPGDRGRGRRAGRSARRRRS